MTNETYERLKAYEHHFFTAINSGYVRLPNMGARKEMLDIYNEISDTPYPNVDWTCSSCVMAFIKCLGKIFYSFTPYKALADTLSNESVPSSVESVKSSAEDKVKVSIVKPIGKRGRPSKAAPVKNNASKKK